MPLRVAGFFARTEKMLLSYHSSPARAAATVCEVPAGSPSVPAASAPPDDAVKYIGEPLATVLLPALGAARPPYIFNRVVRWSAGSRHGGASGGHLADGRRSAGRRRVIRKKHLLRPREKPGDPEWLCPARAPPQ